MNRLAARLLLLCLALAGAACQAAPLSTAAPAPVETMAPPPVEAADLPPTAIQAEPAALPTSVAAAPVASATPGSAPAAPTAASPSIMPTQASQTPAETDWRALPIIPPVSERALEIYRRGVELGNNPQAFSKIGDCGSTPAWFLGDFDRGPAYYDLGPYTDLQPVIEFFQGSYDRTSLAARSGFNAASVFVPLWADRAECQSGETPLACEYRQHRPSIAFIMLGTNDFNHTARFEASLRRVIEFSIEIGVLPILTTKADNLEGDHSINAAIARLAAEYEIPLWNYWLAVQPLPDHGLQPDSAHITWAPNRFSDPQAMEKGWPVRNLTALQALQAVYSAIQASERTP